MANELNIAIGVHGLTNVTASLELAGSSVSTGISITETAVSGFYSGTMPTVSAGAYDVLWYIGSALISVGRIDWRGSAEVSISTGTVNAYIVGCASNTFDGYMFGAGAQGVLSGQWLHGMSATTPPTNTIFGTAYTQSSGSPLYGGKICWQGDNGTFIWWDTTNGCFTISLTPGSRGTSYFTSPDLTEASTWTAGGSASGTPVFVFSPLALLAVDSSGQVTANGVNGNVTGSVGSAPDSSGTTTLLSRITSARAGYLDNLNVGGAVASHSDIQAINQSASKHLLVSTVAQYAPGESYTIEVDTFSASTGGVVNADSTPTITATGSITGSLSANLGSITNPSTGVYRVAYTVPASPTLEQIRIDVSATISAATFTLSAYTQTVDSPTAIFTATDKSNLTSIKAVTDNFRFTIANQVDANALSGTSSAPTVNQIAAGILATPANKLATNADGSVNPSSSSTVNNYVTIPAAIANQSQNASQIICIRGDRLAVQLPLMGSIAGATKMVFTAKSNVDDADNKAVMQIVQGTGLITLNGISLATPDSNCTLTITNSTTGAVNLVVDSATTATLSYLDTLQWDCQVWLTAGISTPVAGSWVTIADVTQALT